MIISNNEKEIFELNRTKMKLLKELEKQQRINENLHQRIIKLYEGIGLKQNNGNNINNENNENNGNNIQQQNELKNNLMNDNNNSNNRNNILIIII